MAAITTYAPGGDPYIDGLLFGKKWSGTTLTFSFPTQASTYERPYGRSEPDNNFGTLTILQKTAARDALSQVSSFTLLDFSEITELTTNHAVIRYAKSNAPSTAWGYFPSTSAEAGDVWFNNNGKYEAALRSSYVWATFLHETGHVLGLKHPHEAQGLFAAMPADHDSLEYTVMSYKSYIGYGGNAYVNGPIDFPTTYMMYDIAALQTLYGADYTFRSSDTRYQWSPLTGEMFVNGAGQGLPTGNRIFMTVWDGGGNDTYDFSNYLTGVTIDLSPGGWTIASSLQLARLDQFGLTTRVAAGNIANAVLHNGDPRALIEHAIGTIANDTLVGNDADNGLNAGAGNDALLGLNGLDTLTGGPGLDNLVGGLMSDLAIYSGALGNYSIVQVGTDQWRVSDLRLLGDGIDTVVDVEQLDFSNTDVFLGLRATPVPVLSAESITDLYIGYFDRAPDPGGLNYWIDRYASGEMNLIQIAESFSKQVESQGLYPFLLAPQNASPSDFLSEVYLNLFNRALDLDGKAYWSKQIADGGSLGRIIIDIISGARGLDLVTIDNKEDVGVYFAIETTVQAKGFGLAPARAVLDGVTWDRSTVHQGMAEVDAFAHGVPILGASQAEAA